MIKRIVRLTFEADKVQEFMAVFEQSRLNIRRFPGCNHLEVWREKANPNVFFTYSFWESEAALDHYRHSELFQRTWSQTKKLFADKPMAWTVELQDIVRPDEK